MSMVDSLSRDFENEALTTRQHFEGLPDEKLDWRPHEKSFPQAGWRRTLPIHHRGQFSVYLRLLNLPVPGSYGPSADEQGCVGERQI